MGQKIFRTEVSVSNVAASTTAQADIPVGQRILGILIQHGFSSGTNTVAGGMTNISKVRFKVDGFIARELSGTKLRDLNLANGRIHDCRGLPNTAPGVSLMLNFAEPWRRDFEDQIAGALPTVWVHGGKENSVHPRSVSLEW